MSLDTHHTATPSTTLDTLLASRAALREHEERLSYWRRVVQGRLDLLEARLAGDVDGTADGLAAVLGRHGHSGRRAAHAGVRAAEPMPELLPVERSWDIASTSTDAVVLAHAVERHRAAERWLSDQRAALLCELDEATAALAERLAEDPAAYLRAVGWVTSAG